MNYLFNFVMYKWIKYKTEWRKHIIALRARRCPRNVRAGALDLQSDAMPTALWSLATAIYQANQIIIRFANIALEVKRTLMSEKYVWRKRLL